MLVDGVVGWMLPTPLHLTVLLLFMAGRTGARGRGAASCGARLLVLVAFGWCALCVTPAVADRLIVALEGDPSAVAAESLPAPSSENRIVVLASGELRSPSGTQRVRLSRDGWERIHGAVALWRAIGGVLVFTGGPNDDPSRSIAASGAALARELGVPASAVTVSPTGTNTREEVDGAAALLAGHAGQTWLVTSALHMRRARLAAAQAGLDPRPHPVAFVQVRAPGWWLWVPSVKAVDRLQAALHEWIGLAAYGLGARR
jgi:uncharacterized SAM-binding protein YcdF (DUF218 family)